MHELSLAASLVELAEEHAKKNGITQVLRVHIALGTLAAVEEEALAFGFDVVRTGTVAADAELVIERVTGRALCETCHELFHVAMPSSPCPACGGLRWKLTASDEMRLTAIEGV